MAEVMIGGLLARGVTPPGSIWASGPREDRAEELRARHGIQGTKDNLKAVANAEIVVLAVKPQTLPGRRPASR